MSVEMKKSKRILTKILHRLIQHQIVRVKVAKTLMIALTLKLVSIKNLLGPNGLLNQKSLAVNAETDLTEASWQVSLHQVSNTAKRFGMISMFGAGMKKI